MADTSKQKSGKSRSCLDSGKNTTNVYYLYFNIDMYYLLIFFNLITF